MDVGVVGQEAWVNPLCTVSNAVWTSIRRQVRRVRNTGVLNVGADSFFEPEALDRLRNQQLFRSVHAMPKAITCHEHLTALGNRQFLCGEAHRFEAFRTPVMEKLLTLPDAGSLYQTTSCCKRRDQRKCSSQQQPATEAAQHCWKEFSHRIGSMESVIYHRGFFRHVFLPHVFALAEENSIAGMELRFNPINKLYVFEMGSRGIEKKKIDPHGELFVRSVLEAASEHRLLVNLILTINTEHHSPYRIKDEIIPCFKWLKSCFEEHVVAFDFVGWEDQRMRQHQVGFVRDELPKDNGWECVLHAGETLCVSHESAWVNTDWESIWHFRPKRIAHPLAMVKRDLDTLQRLRQEKIGLEICLMSNFWFGYIHDLKSHPVQQLIQHGFKVVFGSDDGGVFGTHEGLTWEFLVLLLVMEPETPELFYRINMDSIDCSLFSELTKRKLRASYDAMWTHWIAGGGVSRMSPARISPSLPSIQSFASEPLLSVLENLALLPPAKDSDANQIFWAEIEEHISLSTLLLRPTEMDPALVAAALAVLSRASEETQGLPQAERVHLEQWPYVDGLSEARFARARAVFALRSAHIAEAMIAAGNEGSASGLLYRILTYYTNGNGVRRADEAAEPRKLVEMLRSDVARDLLGLPPACSLCGRVDKWAMSASGVDAFSVSGARSCSVHDDCLSCRPVSPAMTLRGLL
eukprot:TRINITY_DN74845_c0_g1_i1.p1 TRINITY_DN74845_c0_g1~~TRINITY_DN74845_c0_g1_i1.p1  ORF type:complete len:706 (-),score=109.75 TRINITY_DN74845_c0_g1_i1:8-2083(-)